MPNMFKHQGAVRSDDKSAFHSMNIGHQISQQVPVYKNASGRKFVSPQISRKHMDTMTHNDPSRNNRG